MSNDSVAMQRFLADAALIHETTPDLILRNVLHLGSVRGEIEAQIGLSSAAMRDLFRSVDYGLHVRNPGLHYVPRKTYVGYRRENTSGAVSGGDRSQVFASVLRKMQKLIIVLPLDPRFYAEVPIVSDSSERGHHGIGSLKCTLSTTGDAELFFSTFDTWLRPSCGRSPGD